MKWPTLPALKPRERLLALGCGAMLLVVALDRLVLSPWAKHARTVRQDIRHMQEALQTHAQLLSRRERVFGELQQYQRYLKPVEADDLQKAALIHELQDLAAQSAVTVGEIKALASESDEASRRYPLELHFQCTLDTWVDFLYHLETAASLYQVVRAGLSVHEGEPDQLDGYLRIVSVALPSGTDAPTTGQGGRDVVATP